LREFTTQIDQFVNPAFGIGGIDTHMVCKAQKINSL